MLSFDVFSVGPQQPVERAVELTMTWDTMTLMWRHGNVINSYHIVMFVIAARNCGHHRYFKIYMKWGQRNFSTNVYNKPKGILNPLSWLWLAGLYVIEALFHMLPPRCPLTSWLTLPGHGIAAWLRTPCTQTGAQGATADPVGHWIRLQGSPTVVSTVTRTRISLWWNMLYVPVPGWTHSMKLYPNIKMCFHRILEQLVGTLNYFVCISVSEIYLETFHVWVTKTLLRPVHGAMICPKRRTLCSIAVRK